MGKLAKENIKLRGRTWYCNFTDRHSGEAIRAALKTGDKDEAKRRVVEWQQWCEDRAVALKLSRPVPAMPGERPTGGVAMTLGELLEQRFEQCVKGTAQAGTITTIHNGLRRYLGVNILVTTLTTEVIKKRYIERRLETRAWARQAPPRPSTINRALAELRRALSWGGAKFGFPPPAVNFTRQDEGLKQRVPPRAQPILKGDEEARLRFALEPDLRQVFDFALLSGLRQMNCLLLKKRQVTWDHTAAAPYGYVTVIQKGGREHVVPLDGAMRSILETAAAQSTCENVFTWRCLHGFQSKKWDRVRIRGERYAWERAIFYKRWYDATGQAMIDKPWHGLTRGTAITEWILSDGIYQASRNAGHTDIKTTQIYGNMDLADKFATVERRGVLRNQRRAAAQEAHSAHARQTNPDMEQRLKVVGE